MLSAFAGKSWICLLHATKLHLFLLSNFRVSVSSWRRFLRDFIPFALWLERDTDKPWYDLCISSLFFNDSNTIHDCNDTFEMFSSRSTFYIAILKPQRPQKQQPKTKQNKVMGLSTFHLVEPAHSTSASGCWLPAYEHSPRWSCTNHHLVCACGSGTFYSVKSAQFHHSFTHNLISFSSNGVTPRTKLKYT